MNEHNPVQILVYYTPGDEIQLNPEDNLEQGYRIAQKMLTMKYLHEKVQRQIPNDLISIHQRIQSLRFRIQGYHGGSAVTLNQTSNWHEYHALGLIFQPESSDQLIIIGDDIQGNIIAEFHQGDGVEIERTTLMHKDYSGGMVIVGSEMDSETETESADGGAPEYNYQTLRRIQLILGLDNDISQILDYIMSYYRLGIYRVTDPALDEYFHPKEEDVVLPNFSALRLFHHHTHHGYQKYLTMKSEYAPYDHYVTHHGQDIILPWNHQEDNYPWFDPEMGEETDAEQFIPPDALKDANNDGDENSTSDGNASTIAVGTSSHIGTESHLMW